MIDTQQLQTLGNQVAKEIETKYPTLTIAFTASPVPNEDQTFAEVMISDKEGSGEKIFEIGVIDHPTAPNLYRFQMIFTKRLDNYAREFLGIR